VGAYLEQSRIDLQFLPAYAPNLNLIERFWRFFKRQVLYNRYYEHMPRSCARC
jgi:transposase